MAGKNVNEKLQNEWIGSLSRKHKRASVSRSLGTRGEVAKTEKNEDASPLRLNVE